MFSSDNLDVDGAQLLRSGLTAASFEHDLGGWHGGNLAESVNVAQYTDPSRAHDGAGFGEMNVSQSGASIAQDVALSVSAGDSYRLSMWLRAAPGVGSITGRLTLWGLGTTDNESGGTNFTVGESWTLVDAPLDARGAHSQVRAEIYLYTGGNLDADGAQLMKAGLVGGSFENDLGGWHPGADASSVNLVQYSGADRAHDGSGWAETNTSQTGASVAQDVPTSITAGDSYAFSVWMRAAPGVGTFHGTLTLWGLGGAANESAPTTFTVGEQWTQVTAPLDAGVDHTLLRAEIYLDSPGNLDLDGATLAAGGARADVPPLQVAQQSLSSAIVGTSWSTSLTATGGTAPYRWSLQSGVLPNGLSLDPAGTINGTPTTAGSSVLTFAVTDTSVPARVTTTDVEIAVSDPLRVTTSTLPGAVVAVSYSTGLTVAGARGNASWTVAGGSVPAGLRLTTAGVLVGRPTAAGTYRFVVRVADAAASPTVASRSLVLRVAGVVVSTSVVSGGVVGKSYAVALSAQGGVGAKSWAVTSGALPAGVTLSSTGRLSGTPSAAGSFRFTVSVSDAASPANSASRAFVLVVAPLAVRTTTLRDGTVGVAYSQPLLAWGGTAPMTWAVVSGVLPPGVTLSSNGVLTGRTTTAGTSTFTVRVLDASRKSATAVLSITVS